MTYRRDRAAVRKAAVELEAAETTDARLEAVEKLLEAADRLAERLTMAPPKSETRQGVGG